MNKQVVLSGGLGNQMFQSAFFLSLRKRGIGCRLNATMYQDFQIHQGFELQRVFGINDVVLDRGKLSRMWLRLMQKYHPFFLVCKDPIITYYEQAYRTHALYYIGYWMNDAYFQDLINDVREAFVFQGIDKYNETIAGQMKEQNAISLHIRRGDYLKDNNYRVCTEVYYRKSIEYINSHVNRPFFYVFSDDPEWCRDFMSQFRIDFRIINHNRGKDSYKDMYLMSQCSHNIIANSTFSWWGAWLNGNTNKIVIAPSPWWNLNEKTPVCKGWTLIKSFKEER